MEAFPLSRDLMSIYPAIYSISDCHLSEYLEGLLEDPTRSTADVF